jgi:uncharacterized membrane-anchored protein
MGSASKAGSSGPSDVTLIDQAKLKLPANYFFVPKAEAARALRTLGNVVDDTDLIGLVVGERQSDQWIVVIRYIKEGYIRDDDAKNWNADELLKNITEGVEETNKDRYCSQEARSAGAWSGSGPQVRQTDLHRTGGRRRRCDENLPPQTA